MEAVGAAGAIVGLAGSALTGLKYLTDFIAILQDGQIDLCTAQSRLAEHESRLLELRNDYDSLPNGSITDEENALLDSCIKDSYEELERFRTRLEKMAKTRTRGQSLQRVETAVRMFMSEGDVKKHKSLLQDRILRLEQFSERANRVRVNESFQSIRSAAAQFHAEDMTIHSRISSALEAASEGRERQSQQLSNMQSFWVAHMTAVIEEHNQDTATLIQSSSHSSVLEMKKNMEQTFQTMQLALRNQDRISQKQQRNSRHLLHDVRDNGYYGDNQALPYVSFVGADVYRTPFGRFRVSRDRMHCYTTGRDHGGPWRVVFRIRFEPYRCFSLKFVEWRCHLTMGINNPSVKIQSKMGILCEDDDVLEALGLIRDPYCDICESKIYINGCAKHPWRSWWRTKLPNPGKLRRLLAERRFGPHDSLRADFQRTRSILSVFASNHRLCEQARKPLRIKNNTTSRSGPYETMPHCYSTARHLIMEDGWDAERDVIDTILIKTSEDFDNLARFYPAYYETLEMLLKIGCRPDGDDWGSLQGSITGCYRHILGMHPRYAASDYFQLYSAMKLVRNAAASPIAMGELHWRPCGPQGTFAQPYLGIVSYVGHLLPFQNCIQETTEILFDIGGLDALDEQLVCDRWLLVLMIHIKPELRTLITGNAGYRTSADLTIERICMEIQRASIRDQIDVILYVILYGNAVLVQLLIQNGVDPTLILQSAAERGVPEIFDFVLDSHLQRVSVSELKRQLSGPLMQRRIGRDPGFMDRLLNLMVLPGQWEPSQKYDDYLLGDVNGFLLNKDHVLRPLIRKDPTEALGPVGIMVDGCIFWYEQEHCRFPEGLRVYLQYGMFATMIDSKIGKREDLGSRASAFHQVLRRLLASSVFRCGLEYAPQDSSSLDHVAATKGYTPLMVALYGGMIPAVEILVGAGAEITKCAPCGLSALQLAEQNAQGKHPRACKTHNPTFRSTEYEGFGPTGFISCSSDETMLEMLRDALRSRGMEVPEPGLPKTNLEALPHCPAKPSCKARNLISFTDKQTLRAWVSEERLETLLSWLFKPTVVISIEGLRDPVLDIVVVCTFTFLSIARLLQEDAEIVVNFVRWALKLLSRPIVMVLIVAWAFTTVWRHFVTAT